MWKTTTLKLIFLVMLTGISSAFGACSFFERDDVQKSSPMPDAVVESPTVNSANKTPPLSREILPCKDANSFKHESNLKEMAVSLGVVNSRVLCGALPEYPKKLKDKNISGEVKISVGINEAGEVSGTNFISGDRSYSKPAQKAAYQTKFAPVLIEGKARRAYGVLIYEFDGKQGTKLQEINQ